MRRYQFTIVSAVLYILIGITGLLLRYDFARAFNLDQIVVLFSALILLFLGIVIVLFVYLQGGFGQNLLQNNETEYMLLRQMEKFKIDLYSKVENLEVPSIDETKVQELLNKKVDEITDELLFEKIRLNYEDRLIEDIKFKELEKELVEIKYRITSETSRTSRNANLNLLIGFFTTAMAISILAYSLWTTPASATTTPTTFIYHFIPRLSLSIFIELFSFFFLRIYKKNLEDIKYLNNERTNIDLKLVALLTAISRNYEDSIKNVINDLSKTERNFILKKDESTVEVEKSKIELQTNNKILDSLSGVLKK